MVLIRRQMKARQNCEGHRLSTWLSECFRGERHKDPYGIKQTLECLVLKTVNSICVDWTYAARLGSQCFPPLWISSTCNLPEPCRHWHPWNPCQPLPGCPSTLPMVQDPISAQLSPIKKLISRPGLGCQGCLWPPPGCPGPCWGWALAGEILPCCPVPCEFHHSQSQGTALAQHENLHEVVEHQPDPAEMQVLSECLLGTSQVPETPRVGLETALLASLLGGRMYCPSAFLWKQKSLFQQENIRIQMKFYFTAPNCWEMSF